MSRSSWNFAAAVPVWSAGEGPRDAGRDAAQTSATGNTGARIRVAEEPEGDTDRSPLTDRKLKAPPASELGKCERQHARQRQKHRARVVVPVGVNLFLGQLDLPSRQDLVALEALANPGQSLIELRAVASKKGDGKKQSGSELLRIRRPGDRFKLRDLHDHRFSRLASWLQAEMLVDRGLQLGLSGASGI